MSTAILAIGRSFGRPTCADGTDDRTRGTAPEPARDRHGTAVGVARGYREGATGEHMIPTRSRVPRPSTQTPDACDPRVATTPHGGAVMDHRPGTLRGASGSPASRSTRLVTSLHHGQLVHPYAELPASRAGHDEHDCAHHGRVEHNEPGGIADMDDVMELLLQGWREAPPLELGSKADKAPPLTAPERRESPAFAWVDHPRMAETGDSEMDHYLRTGEKRARSSGADS